MKDRKLSLKVILILSFTVLVIAASVTVGFFSYQQSYKALISSAEEKLVGQSDTMLANLDLFMQSVQQQVGVLANLDQVNAMADGTASIPALMKAIKAVQVNASDFSSVFFGMRDKRFFVEPAAGVPAGFDPTSKPWYQDALKAAGKIIWTDPYKNVANNEMFVTVARAVMVNGEVIGVVGGDVSLKSLTDRIRTVKIGKDGYLYMTNRKGVMLGHKDEKLIGTDFSKEPSLQRVFSSEKGLYSYMFGNPPTERMQAFVTSGVDGWKIGAVLPKSELQAMINSLKVYTVVITVIIVLLAITLSVIISSILAKQIKSLTQSMDRASQGDLTVYVEDNVIKEFSILGKSYNIIIKSLNQVLGEINTAAEQVAAGAKQVSDSSQALSEGSTEQASAIEQLTASMEEIASQTKQNATNANQANELANMAKENATQGNERMRGMLKAMDEINEASTSISKIIKVIDEIAFQTNILALNAAVEAARAGQHGKGFAVVAEEVRNLAARSANAAKETTTMIEGSIKKVEDGTKIANNTAEALNKIVEGITKATMLVGDIATASNEQAAAIAQVNQGIFQVSDVTQTNSATAEEGAAASEELSGQAELMKDMVGKFKLDENKKTGMEKLSPDVLRMLGNMSEKRKLSHYEGSSHTNHEATAGKSKIILSDKEFGKY